ncbi:MAG TPA: tetratricopeptide repeat protein [Thermoanaerobaculia bacterium]|nr:tetratricopeptide repeat protein [Thermoanaerobaculia bacterium]
MTADAPALTRNRYPGTRPFGDSPDDRARFFGRDEEAEQIYLRVLSVPLLVQFGKSGLGKTSLLQAGLFPRLREKAFLPVMIRLNVSDPSLTAAVIRSFEESCKAAGVTFNPGDTSGLWELLSTTTIWSDDLLLTPVLVFDQFEEVFTLRDAAFRAELAAELGPVACGVPPPRLQGTKPFKPNVKIVISLREDYLGGLEAFSEAIPGLFHERLRLEPLSQESARESIVRPARLPAPPGETPFWSPPFEYDPAALDAMVVYLAGSSGVIEPFQLQLLCRHAEIIAHGNASAAAGGAITLTPQDFQGAQRFESVLKNFYRDTLAKVSSGSERKKAADLCEEGLLGSGGHRLMLEERQIIGDYDVSKETLATLERERLVLRERRLESVFYEISHDRLAESIFAARGNKLPRRLRRTLWAIGVVTALAVIGLVAFNVMIQKERDHAEGMLTFLLGEQFLGELRNTGRSSILEQVQQQIDESRGADALSPMNRGLALRNAGDIARNQGHSTAAVGRYKESLDVFAEINSGDVQAVAREAARSHERLALVLADQGNFPEAERHYVAAIAEWRRVVGSERGTVVKTPDCNALANALTSAAFLNQHLRKPELARRDADEAVRIVSDVLFGGSGTCAPPDYPMSRPEPYPDADAVGVLSDVALLQSDYAGAATLAQELGAWNVKSIDARKRAINAGMSGAGARATAQEILDDYRQGLDEYQQLLRLEPGNRLWQRDHAMAQVLVATGIFACRTGRNKCEELSPLMNPDALILDAIAVLRTLVALDPANAAWKEDLAWAQKELDLSREPGRTPGAQLGPVVAVGPDLADLESRREKLIELFLQATALKSKQDAGVSSVLEQTVSEAREYIRLAPAHPAGYESLTWASLRLAKVHNDHGDIGARAAASQAAINAAQLRTWLDSSEEAPGIIGARLQFSTFLFAQNRDEDALAMLEALVAAAERLVDVPAAQPRHVAHLGFAHGLLGSRRHDNGIEGWEEAIRSGLIYTEKAVEMNEPMFRQLGNLHLRFAQLLESDDRKKEAEVEYRLALDAYRRTKELGLADADVLKAIGELEARPSP